MRPAMKLLPVALLALASACVNVHTTRLGPERESYPPVHRDEVMVYETEADIEGGFEKIAIVFTDAEANWTNERQMINAARKRAGELGANALVIGEFREPGGLAQVAAVVFDAPVKRRARFLAVRVHHPEDDDHVH